MVVCAITTVVIGSVSGEVSTTIDLFSRNDSATAAAAAATTCGANVYAADCLSSPGCVWCCQAAFGYQCLPANSSATCPSDALLHTSDDSCARACQRGGSSCEKCEGKNWCYYCITTETCQIPEASCEGDRVVQSCRMILSPNGGENLCWIVLSSVGGGMIAIAIAIAGGVRVRQCVEDRRHAAEGEARQPLLADFHEAAEEHEPADESRRRLSGPAQGTATPSTRTSSVIDEEALCYLCLEARPSVAFLPCYHACCCEACSNRLRPSHGELHCPFCRRKIEAMVSLHDVFTSLAKAST